MTAPKRFTIGTRGSDLALAQANQVCDLLLKRHPDWDVRCEIIRTIGDIRTDVALAEVARVSGVADKGIFIKELEVALEQHRVDVAVHSLKDLPSVLDAGFILAATLPRANAEDVLVSKTPDWNGSGVLATGSVRRRLMARSYWGEALQIDELRGNVPTRLSKLTDRDDWDAIILARAGLERLGVYQPHQEWNGTTIHMRPLPLDQFVPAVGQGIIGIECRSDDLETQTILKEICDSDSFLCAQAERAFLAHLGASCSTPVGVYAWIDGDSLHLAVKYYPEDGSKVREIAIKGSPNAPLDLGKQAFHALNAL